MTGFPKVVSGVTETERLLSSLCQKTFLRLWSYANLFNDKGQEFCDLLAIFEDRVFIFFDRESRRFDNKSIDVNLSWGRWKKEVIDKQIKTANGAERYLRRGGPLFLDKKGQQPLPINLANVQHIHKIVVAHGASEACKRFSEQNIFGSLGVWYEDTKSTLNEPFCVSLEKEQKIHLFDSANLKLILTTLDTLYDFSAYISEKERAIDRYAFLSYCGEEDLLAHYLMNYNKKEKCYSIGKQDVAVLGLSIGEGEWSDFSDSAPYKRRLLANEVSYFWDELIQRTSQNFLDGTVGGNSNIYRGESAIFEMAKEPRFFRRALAENMLQKVAEFPNENSAGHLMRHMSVMPSFYKDKMYVFLQLQTRPDVPYKDEYRVVRRQLLEIACGVTKNRNPHLNKVIGIAVEPPKLNSVVSEDFILLNCEEWPDETRDLYTRDNDIAGFYKSKDLVQRQRTHSDFPSPQSETARNVKPGRNQSCPCGSGKKYKRCCGGN